MKFPKLGTISNAVRAIPRRVVYLTLGSAAVLVLLNGYDERGVIEPDTLKDEFTMLVMRPLETPARRLLATHLPGLFPLKFSCVFTGEDKKWNAVLPGDEIAPAKSGNLQCTNGDHFHFESGASARIWAHQGDHTRLEVDAGIATADLTTQEIEVVLSGATAEVKANHPTRVLASAASQGGYLGCESGGLNVTLSRRMELPLTLDARDCRIDVKRKGEDREYTLTDGERTPVADLTVPPATWPLHRAPPSIELYEKTAPAIAAGIRLSRAAGSVVATSTVDQKDCSLNALSTGGAGHLVKKVPQLSQTATIELPKSERRPLFLSCESQGTLHSSNLVAAIPRGLATAMPFPDEIPAAPPKPVAAAPAPVMEVLPGAAPSDLVMPPLGAATPPAATLPAGTQASPRMPASPAPTQKPSAPMGTKGL